MRKLFTLLSLCVCSLTSFAYDSATEAGQKTFMEDLQSVIKNNSNILGYLYWDPIMVDQQVNGSWIKDCWAEIQTSGVWYENGNTALSSQLSALCFRGYQRS